jgi:hypothetical protein
MTFERYVAAFIDFVIISGFILILYSFSRFKAVIPSKRFDYLIIQSLISKKARRYYYQDWQYPHINDGIVSVLALRTSLARKINIR